MNRLEWHNWNPVLCMTIVDNPLEHIGKKTNVLLWIRTPDQKTHIWVLSSFTQRYNSLLLNEIDSQIWESSLSFRIWDDTQDIWATQFAIERLMGRKLWSIDNPDNNPLITCKFGFIETGIPNWSNPHDQREYVTMYNLLCYIQWWNPPTDTRSYRDIYWRNAEDFVTNRLSGSQICDGLCISTSKKALILCWDFQ